MPTRLEELMERTQKSEVTPLHPVSLNQEQLEKAPELQLAIARLVQALQASKGWMHDYAECLIQDAIDRTHVSQYTKLQQSLPDDIRAEGWVVAIHNDYRLNNEVHTFWLFTKAGRAVKGEGKSDAEALNQVRAELGLLFA